MLRNEYGNLIWEPSGKIRENGYELMEDLSNQGQEIFILPNIHESGIQQRDTLGTNVIFCEADDCSIEEQEQKLKEKAKNIGLRPTLVVNSGGKSLHISFGLTETLVDLETIRRLQRKVIIIFGSDRTIENSNREMRFAGVFRKAKENYQKVLLYSWQDRYTPEELEGILDSYIHEQQDGEETPSVIGFPNGLTDKHWRKYVEVCNTTKSNEEIRKILLKTEKELNPPKSPELNTSTNINLNYSTTKEIPLEIFFSKDDAEIFNRGMSQGTGGRNPTALRLAATLNGRVIWLDDHNIKHSNNVPQLIQGFCDRCSPPLGSTECDRVLTNASKNAHTKLPDDAFWKKIGWYLWENDKEEWARLFKKDYQEKLTEDKKLSKMTPQKAAEIKQVDTQIKSENPTVESNNIVCYNYKKGWENWLKACSFTPDFVINSRYFDFDYSKIYKKVILGIRAPLGNGKTQWAVHLIKVLGLRSLIINHRNSLCYEISERIKKETDISVYHGNEDQGFSTHQYNNELTGIVTCIDSLLKMKISEVKGRVIFLDEVESLLYHLLSSGTLKKERERIIKHFAACIDAAEMVIVMDGNLTDTTMEYLHKLAPSKNVQKIGNEWKPEALNITHLVGSITENFWEAYTEEQLKEFWKIKDLPVKWDDNSPFIQMLLAHQENLKNFCVASDSKRQLHSLHDMYTRKGMLSVIITSRSLEENWTFVEGDPDSSVRNFMSNPDAFIRKYQPRCVLYSPTIESGSDISIKDYFEAQYNLFWGVLGAFSNVQMMGRVRDPKTARYLWQNSKPLGQSYDYTSCDSQPISDLYKKRQEFYTEQLRKEAIAKEVYRLDFQAIHMEAARLADESCTAEKIHLDLYADIEARVRFEKANPRMTTLHLLSEAGNKIQDVVMLESLDAKAEVKEVANRMKDAEADLVSKATAYSHEEAEKIKAKLVKTPAETNNLSMTFINNSFPNIQKSDYWNNPENGKEFCRTVLFDDRKFIQHQKNFWMFNHIDVMNKEEVDSWIKKIEKEFKYDTHHRFAGDVNTNYSKILLLKEWGFDWFLNKENTWHAASPEVVKFMKKFNTKHDMFGKEFPVGIPPKNTKPGSKLTPEQVAERAIQKLLRELIQFVGGDTVNCKRMQCEDGKSRSVFTLDTEKMSDPKRLVAQQMLDDKHKDWTEGDRQIKEFSYYELSGTAAEKLLAYDPGIDESIFEKTPEPESVPAAEVDEEVPVTPEPLFEIGMDVEGIVDDVLEIGLVSDRHYSEYDKSWMYNVELADGCEVYMLESMLVRPNHQEEVDVVALVDAEIQKSEPYWTPESDTPVKVWQRRLMKAQTMGADIAKKLYNCLPHDLLNNAWAALTSGVQRFYLSLFGEGTTASA
ncbi:MAG: hypothetical protein PUP93_16725 [Rhizonema sp. NSF051]|nr:hypothetical protein [Rhizonema sp. NSF051]